MTARVVEFFEIKIPRCEHVYSVLPCTASGTPCFQCLATCQDTENFSEETATLRFAKPAAYLKEAGIDHVGPWIKSIEHTSATISLAENLGTRAVLRVVLEDHPHSDAGEGLDPYFADRGYDPYKRGTFWPRFKARYPSCLGFECAWVIGEVGQALEDMERRTFYIEAGPVGDGDVTITAKDALKFLDGDRAQIPVLSEGALVADISATANEVTLAPSGIGETYDAEGYVNLAGKEIARYWRTGLDQYVKLLLHMEGADGSTTFTDSSDSPHTVTVGGNAQIDTEQFKFGSSSAQFDGTGDYLQLDGSDDFAFGTEDFTIDGWIRLGAGSLTHVLYDSRPIGVSSGIYPMLYVNSDDTVRFFVNGADRIITPAISTAYWHHIALSRAGGVTRLFINGTQFGSSYTDANAYLNGASRPTIGISGVNLSSSPLLGRIDELRVTKGFARYTAGFTVPAGPAPLTTDVLTLAGRGQLGSTAATHSAGDRVQLCKIYSSTAAADILADAIENFSDLPADYIPLEDWQLEDSTNLGTLYTFMLVEPTSLSAFAGRVLEQSGSMMWDDPLAKKLRFKVIKAVPTSADVISEANVINKSFKVTEQTDQRVSRVNVYYAVGDPTKKRDDLANYRQTVRVPDDDVAEASERLYGSTSIRTIFADGIAIGGASVAQRVGNLLVGRKQRPPRRFEWLMLRTAPGLPQLGSGYFIDWRSLQDASGARERAPVQIISAKVSATIVTFIAVEMRFTDLDAGSSTDRVLLINFDTFNLNLRDVHDQIYPSEFTGVTVTFLISSTVGSTSTSVAAIIVGTWPVGFVPTVINTGRIAGKAGNGGVGGIAGAGSPGQAGGPALLVDSPIDLDNADGEIDGGGGGGGGGGALAFLPGGGGGGGGGNTPGLGAADGLSNPSGSNGTETAGGPGGPGTGGGAGGAGGNPGSAGSAGGAGTFGRGSGGAAGPAIDGISNVTDIGADPGTIRGSTIN